MPPAHPAQRQNGQAAMVTLAFNAAKRDKRQEIGSKTANVQNDERHHATNEQAGVKINDEQFHAD